LQDRQIAIVICSRGREELLARLLADLDSAYMPALEAGGMTCCTFVYAQGYDPAFIAALSHSHADTIAAGRLVIHQAERAHARIGDVFATAIAALHASLDYRLAMLMDDDSLYRAEPVVDENLRQAARQFLDRGDRAYSIKLGQSRRLEFWPFIDPDGAIMPFKEKMMWVSRAVMEEALAFAPFATLSVGEDAVMAALAWRGGASRCFGVFGIASFLHLGFEPDGDAASPPVGGGYGELVGYDEASGADPDLGKYGSAFRSGVVPHTIMPEIFVGPEHPFHTISGIRPEAVQRYGGGTAAFRKVERPDRR